jgi:Alternative oxidase
MAMQAIQNGVANGYMVHTQVVDHLAYYSIQSVRVAFDVVTNYGHGKMNREKWLTRLVFLETVAGVPGMVAGMIRHLHSLRLMRRDFGWIHTLLEEAENERMHLLTFMLMKKPGARPDSHGRTRPCCDPGSRRRTPL